MIRSVMLALVFSVSNTVLAQSSSLPQLTEELRLDATREDFPSVLRVYVGSRGEIAVPVLSDQQLRLYDSNGNRIGNIGRRGSGPGEFLGIGQVGWLADTIWVVDQQLRRTTFFDRNLGLLRVVLWAEEAASTQPASIRFFSPFSYSFSRSAIGHGLTTNVTSETRRTPTSVIASRSTTGSLTAIARFPSPEESPWILWAYGTGRNLPFAMPITFSVAHDGSGIALLSARIPERQEAEFTVSYLTLSGDTTFSRSYPYRAELIPSRSVDSALATFESARAGSSPNLAALAKQFQTMARDRMPRWFTSSESILVGLDKTIWVGMRPTAAGRQYLVLDQLGERIGIVLVPVRVLITQASAQYIWAIDTDPDGLSSVVRYRVNRLGCSPAC